MNHELGRRRSRAAEPEPAGDRAAERPTDHLLALQRGVGNQAVARLLVSENVLQAPGSWLDQSAGERTLRELWKARDSKLVSQLQASLPRPDLKGVREIDAKGLEREVLVEAPWDDGDARGEYVEWAVGELNAHGTLVELDGIDKLQRPASRPIMNAKDLVPEADDLVGLKVGALTKLWCVLIAIVKSEGTAAVRQVLADAKAPKAPTVPKPSDKEPAYYKAMHDYYYGVKGILYDDTAAKPGLLSSFGYKLSFAGPTTFPQLWKAGLKAGDRCIVDVTDHTMYVVVKEDFDKPEHATKPLGTVFTLHNDDKNWNWQDQYTFGLNVLYVYKRG